MMNLKPAPVKKAPCPCMLNSQSIECPFGFPDLLCEKCGGKGHLIDPMSRDPGDVNRFDYPELR